MTADARPMPRGRVIVGRKPVFGPGLEVVGYGLATFRSDGSDSAATLTTDTVLDPPTAGDEIAGLPAVFGSKPAFVRPEGALLTNPDALAAALPAESTVIEVAAGDGRLPGVVDLCRTLAGRGYRLAVAESPEPADGAAPLLELASFIEIDVTRATRAQLEQHARRASGKGITSVAVGVDDLQTLETVRRAGFDLFQGYLLSRPVTVMTEALTPSRLTVLRMIETVNDPATSAADLQKVVEADAGLSYRLLHISSLGAAGGLRRPVHSIREATILLGRDWIYRWLILMLVADANQGVPEQLTIAMTRARMAELVAGGAGLVDQDSAFTVGLLSALDLVLGAPRADIVSKLAITEDLVGALIEGKGPLGAVLHDVLRWEVGDAAGANRSGLDGPALERRYVAALAYAQTLADTLERAEAAA